MPPSFGAYALLHPWRRAVPDVAAPAHTEVELEGDGVTLRGWLFLARGPVRRGTVIYLHGVADNRASGAWVAERLVERGFDVLAYDSRAHGRSDGAACTYGYYEKRDLSRALDQLGIQRAIVVGESLGGAIALQAAADDQRIAGVVAAATFSDLESIARERAPFFATGAQIRSALRLAEREAHFRVSEVSPVASARRIRVPVLLVHGADDDETRVAHSRRILEALDGPKELRVIDGAQHEDVLGKAWPDVERWIADVSVRAQ